ncbi:hypothetical protein [Bacillus sp. LJBS17]|uniref:hypothetical protein n=1 Tax=Bacillus sp. LJBS17 TaxID=2859227 RepID=UPI001C5795B2|nr:hypothetical protein [Bacillus sp. LJBS17]QXW84074.1 hypothetical protein KXZ66_22235 [Bacillus sp. LJBS17]
MDNISESEFKAALISEVNKRKHYALGPYIAGAIKKINFEETGNMSKEGKTEEDIEFVVAPDHIDEFKVSKAQIETCCLYVYSDRKPSHCLRSISFTPEGGSSQNMIKKTTVPNITSQPTSSEIYEKFIDLVKNTEYDEIESTYLKSACQSGQQENWPAAIVMLGVAAERLLILITEAYHKYLLKEDATKAEKFKKNVVDAYTASKRLDGLYNEVDEKVTKKWLEKIKMHLRSFDLLRQLRNDAGHPSEGIKEIIKDTGHIEQFFKDYYHLYKKFHKLIEELPK